MMNKHQTAGLLLAVLLWSSGSLMAAESAPTIWTLKAALTHAQTNSPDARIAMERIKQSEAVLLQAQSVFQPRVQLQSSYIRTDNPVSVFGAALNQRSFGPALNFNDVPDADNFNVRSVFSYPLYSGGRNVALRESALAGTSAANQDAFVVQQELAFAVARTFHEIQKAGALIQAANASVNALAGNLLIAQKRFNAGTILKAEVLDIEVRLAQAREDAVRAGNGRALAERALRNLLGVESGSVQVAETPADVPSPDAKLPAQRPEMKLLQARQRAAAAQVEAARSGFKPQVSAFASLDQDYGFRFGGNGRSYTTGVMAQWNLWDGKLTRGKVDEARSQQAALNEMERKLRLAIDFEVEQARLNLTDADQRLLVTEKSIAQAAESVELTRARFEQGLAMTTQLIDAEAALTGARVRRAEAQADRRIAVAALRRALGLPQMEQGN